MKVIVVGGVAGGASAAARIRRLDEAADVVVYERSGYISYANCGLPYYIGGAITDPAQLTLQTPESFWRRFRIRMKVRHEVLAIHPQRKAVTVRNLATGAVFEDTYDKLLLSPGAAPCGPTFRAWMPSGCSRCALWRIPSKFTHSSGSTARVLPCWPAAASLGWSWPKTCASAGWR